MQSECAGFPTSAVVFRTCADRFQITPPRLLKSFEIRDTQLLRSVNGICVPWRMLRPQALLISGHCNVGLIVSMASSMVRQISFILIWCTTIIGLKHLVAPLMDITSLKI